MESDESIDDIIDLEFVLESFTKDEAKAMVDEIADAKKFRESKMEFVEDFVKYKAAAQTLPPHTRDAPLFACNVVSLSLRNIN